MATWTKDKTKLYLDKATEDSANDWARVRKSTIFDLNLNPETETLDFIDQESPSDILKNYKLTLDQESQLEEGDELFDYMFEMLMERPVGSEAVRPVLIIFPKAASTQGSFVAWMFDATVTLKNYNTVDRKLTFSIAAAGDVVKGTATVEENKPVFTPDANAQT